MDRDSGPKAEEWRVMMQKTADFDSMLIETIDEVLRNIFDDETARTILHHVDESSGGKIEDRIQTFTDSLPKILGDGATIVEDLILETLYSKLRSELRWRKDYGFLDYVQALKKEAWKE